MPFDGIADAEFHGDDLEVDDVICFTDSVRCEQESK